MIAMQGNTDNVRKKELKTAGEHHEQQQANLCLERLLCPK